MGECMVSRRVEDGVVGYFTSNVDSTLWGSGIGLSVIVYGYDRTVYGNLMNFNVLVYTPSRASRCGWFLVSLDGVLSSPTSRTNSTAFTIITQPFDAV